MNAVVKDCAQNKSPDNGSVVIVCPGDKFAKTTNILNRSLQYTAEMAYPIYSDFHDDDIQLANQMRYYWNLDTRMVREEFEDASSDIKL
jgi:hypothetical protein